MTEVHKCPCGKSHKRNPDGTIGTVRGSTRASRAPATDWTAPIRWAAAHPPRAWEQQIHAYMQDLVSETRDVEEHRRQLYELYQLREQAQREREPRRGQRVDQMIMDEVAWDDTPLREAQLHRLYANTPEMTPERMRQIIWADMRQG